MEDSNKLAKFVDKILEKHDDHPSIYYTGIIYRYFINFKRVTRSDHGRSANEFNKILEYEGHNYYIASGNGCFLNCINFFFKKDFSMEYFEPIPSYKRRPNVMARCRIPKFYERYKIGIGIYDPKNKKILEKEGLSNRGINVYTFKKIINVLFGRKIEKMLYLMG